MATGEQVEKAKLESIDTDKGNTNNASALSVFRINAKNIILTVNEKSMEHLNDIVKYLGKYKNCQYMLVCSHNKPQFHYHIYVQYSNTVHLSSQWLFGSHIEKCKGSAQQNIRYCKGEDEKHKTLGIECKVILEKGEADYKGVPKTIKEVKMMKIEDLEELDPKYYRTIKQIKQDIEEEEAIDNWLDDHNLKVVWHYGESGSGKTYACKSKGREYRAKGKNVAVVSWDNNGFAHFIGSKQCELLIINEFRDSCLKLKDFLEVLTNEYMYNIKNGQVYLRNLKTIEINSIQSPSEIYEKRCTYEQKYQIERRITEIYYHFKNKIGEPMIKQITWKDLNKHCDKNHKPDSEVVDLDEDCTEECNNSEDVELDDIDD